MPREFGRAEMRSTSLLRAIRFGRSGDKSSTQTAEIHRMTPGAPLIPKTHALASGQRLPTLGALVAVVPASDCVRS